LPAKAGCHPCRLKFTPKREKRKAGIARLQLTLGACAPQQPPSQAGQAPPGLR
jgi:hypothetical protein